MTSNQQPRLTIIDHDEAPATSLIEPDELWSTSSIDSTAVPQPTAGSTAVGLPWRSKGPHCLWCPAACSRLPPASRHVGVVPGPAKRGSYALQARSMGLDKQHQHETTKLGDLRKALLSSCALAIASVWPPTTISDCFAATYLRQQYSSAFRWSISEAWGVYQQWPGQPAIIKVFAVSFLKWYVCSHGFSEYYYLRKHPWMYGWLCFELWPRTGTSDDQGCDRTNI